MDYINIELTEGYTVNTVSYQLASEQGEGVVPTYQRYFDDIQKARTYFKQLTNNTIRSK